MEIGSVSIKGTVIVKSKETKDNYLKGFYYYGEVSGGKVYITSPIEKEVCVVDERGLEIVSVDKCISCYEVKELDRNFEIEWLLFGEDKFKVHCKKGYKDITKNNKYEEIFKDGEEYEIKIGIDKSLIVVGEDSEEYRLGYDIGVNYFSK